MLAVSPLWEPGETSDNAKAGTARHRALALHYAGDDSALFGLDDDEAEAIKWAADQVKLLAPIHNFPVEFEKPLSITLPDFSDIRGTADVVCGPVILDLKWRIRRYDEQLASYALGLLQSNPDLGLVRVHLLFGAHQKIQSLEFDLDSAEEMVWRTVQNAREAKECRPSQYCSWCKIRYRCPIYTSRALTVAAGRDDWPPPNNFHASQLDDPNELAKALRLARLLAPWCESVEHHALEAALKRGLVPTGYELKQTKGKQWVNNAAQAFPLAGLTQPDFLACCDVRLNSSKQYPDKVGIIDLFAKQNRMKRAPARRELLAALAPVISTGNGGMKLKESKTNEIDETENTEGD